jgi:hypothetical protein
MVDARGRKTNPHDGGPPDDEGFAPRFSRRRSGYGAEDLAEMASGVAHVRNDLRVEGP